MNWKRQIILAVIFGTLIGIIVPFTIFSIQDRTKPSPPTQSPIPIVKKRDVTIPVKTYKGTYDGKEFEIKEYIPN